MADAGEDTVAWFLEIAEELQKQGGGVPPTPKKLAEAANISVGDARDILKLCQPKAEAKSLPKSRAKAKNMAPSSGAGGVDGEKPEEPNPKALPAEVPGPKVAPLTPGC